MTPPDNAPAGAPLLPRRVALRVLVTQAVLAGVVGVAFMYFYAGLQRDPTPHHVPFAISGSPAVEQAARGLGTVIDVTPVRDDSAARRAVTHRDAVAALSFHGTTTVDLYIASANGSAENLTAETIAAAIARRAGTELHTIDLVPTVVGDQRGLNSFYIALATTVAAFILAQAMFALRELTSLRARLLTMSGFAVVIGTVLSVAAVLVLHLIPAAVITLAIVLTLLAMAVAFPTHALAVRLGPVGITVATLAMTAVGLSTSGGILGPSLLPGPLATLGAALPPGLGLRVIVSASYFHGARAIGPLLILCAWAGAALTVLLIPTTCGRRLRRVLSPGRTRLARPQRSTSPASGPRDTTREPGRRRLGEGPSQPRNED